jgi:peptide deformylase
MPIDPASLRVVYYPDPALRTKAKPVPAVTEEVRAVARRMIELMREHDGIGLAAPQVGVAWRLFVIDVPPRDRRHDDDDEPPVPGTMTSTAGPTVYINPALAEPAGAVELFEEGCLSLPDIRGDVIRPPVVTVVATDLDGRSFTQRTSGLLARCVQHELDHLDGVLILDRMTQMSRMKVRAAVRDLERRAAKRK